MKIIIVELFKDEDADPSDEIPFFSEVVRNEEGAVMIFTSIEEAEAFVESEGIDNFDFHDLDEIIPPTGDEG